MPNILPTVHPFSDYKIYGPIYHKNEKRNMVNLVKLDKSKRTSMSYARYLMSVHLGRLLNKNEHIDHINNNKLDDRIENFQILTPEDNTRKSAKTQQFFTYQCILCGKDKTVRKGLDFRFKQKGYGYCSRECVIASLKK